MPIGPQPVVLSEPVQPEQVKLCSSCRCQLSLETSVIVDAGNTTDATIVCATCRTAALLTQAMGARRVSRTGDDDAQEDTEHDGRRLGGGVDHAKYAVALKRGVDADVEMDDGGSLRVGRPGTGTHTPVSPRRSALALSIDTANLTPGSNLSHQPAAAAAAAPAASTSAATARHSAVTRRRSVDPDTRTLVSSPDPLVDISRLRVRSQARDCLYPGAEFHGTQKSGRNEYPVHVTIVDVDFASSFLCGYLTICGLTEDWPNLTTYFDAEIIGTRYGFLTQNWDASEAEDRTHWARFPAYRQVKDHLVEPALTMREHYPHAVFMRWKERFLVPDHRVQDINGASFAGFYYMCVDFNPQPGSPVVSPSGLRPSSLTQPEELSPTFYRNDEMDHDARWSASNTSRASRATMSGFYYHQHSEPYQQLSLTHTPESSISSFEFR